MFLFQEIKELNIKVSNYDEMQISLQKATEQLHIELSNKTESEARKQQAEQHLVSVQQELKERQTENDQLSRTIIELQDKENRYSQEAIEHVRNLEKYKMEADEISNLKKENTGFTIKLGDCDKQISDLHLALAEAASEQVGLEMEKNEVQSKLESEIESNSNLKLESQQLEMANSDLKQLLETERISCNQLNNNIRELERKHEEVCKRNLEFEGASEIYTQAAEECNSLRQHLEKLKSEKETLDLEVAECLSYKKDAEELRLRVDELVKQQGELERKITAEKCLQEDNGTLKPEQIERLELR